MTTSPHPQARLPAPGLLATLALLCLPTLAASPTGVTYFHGACDASALVPLPPHHLVVADDEDQVLRLYERHQGGLPVETLNLQAFLRIDPKEPEVDIEAAARIGSRIYWLSSHGRNRKGKPRPSRHRFFATDLIPHPDQPRLVPVGAPYSRLLHDLLQDPRLAHFHIARASLLPPKAPGALCIEGLTQLPDGRLLIGFRNPQPQGHALLIPLENPNDLLAGLPARFGDPILLNLQQRGIRGLGTLQHHLLIIAGSHDSTEDSQLFSWSLTSPNAQPLPSLSLPGLNPEAIEPLQILPDSPWIVASDDGTVRIDGRDCKQLKDDSRKRFRTVIISPALPP